MLKWLLRILVVHDTSFEEVVLSDFEHRFNCLRIFTHVLRNYLYHKCHKRDHLQLFLSGFIQTNFNLFDRVHWIITDNLFEEVYLFTQSKQKKKIDWQQIDYVLIIENNCDWFIKVTLKLWLIEKCLRTVTKDATAISLTSWFNVCWL